MSFSPYYFDQQGTGTGEAIVSSYTNASGVTAIPQAQACSINSSGLIVPLDVSSRSSWQAFVGYANVRIAASSLGPIIANGRLQNITTSYPVGTALYIDTSGNPTNIVPSVGVNGFVSGDACIFMGILVPNETNPSNIDIALFTQRIGIL